MLRAMAANTPPKQLTYSTPWDSYSDLQSLDCYASLTNFLKADSFQDILLTLYSRIVKNPYCWHKIN